MPAERGYMHEVDTSAAPECLEQFHELLDRLWVESPDVVLADRMTFQTAVAEVAANIVEHGARGEPVRLRLVVHVRPDRLEAHFDDRGQEYVEGASRPVGEDEESGRGLAMARAMVDAVLYERDGPVNRWHIYRTRQPS